MHYGVWKQIVSCLLQLWTVNIQNTVELPTPNNKSQNYKSDSIILNKLLNDLSHIPKLVSSRPRPRT